MRESKSGVDEVEISIDTMLLLAYRIADLLFKEVLGGNQSEVLDRK
jgi:hypothetical protein